MRFEMDIWLVEVVVDELSRAAEIGGAERILRALTAAEGRQRLMSTNQRRCGGAAAAIELGGWLMRCDAMCEVGNKWARGR